MTFHKFSAFFAVFSVCIFAAGCNCFNNSTKPQNPFAQNQQTVPPPGTFSSQEAFLGQTPGSFVPQTPATTFPTPQGPVTSNPSATSPSDITLPNTVSGIGEKATLFSSPDKESGWAAVDVATTSKTAFQAMEAKVTTDSTISGDAFGSLIVGASHVVTTITDESTVLNEPATLYSGKFAE